MEEEENNSTNLVQGSAPSQGSNPSLQEGEMPALVCDQSPRVALTNTPWAEHPLADGAKSNSNINVGMGGVEPGRSGCYSLTEIQFSSNASDSQH